jgi:hypothetical protein
MLQSWFAASAVRADRLVHFRPELLRLVLEWANLHRQELIENWNAARQGQPLNPVAPLE